MHPTTKGGRPLAPDTARRKHKCRCDVCLAWAAERSRLESERQKAKRAAGTMPKQRRRMESRECVTCGADFECRASDPTRTCSAACTSAAISQANIGRPATGGWSRRVRAERKQVRAAEGGRGKRVWTTGPCPVCRTPFTSPGAKACSKHCATGLRRGIHTCEHCARRFYPKGKNSKGRFCSTECALDGTRGDGTRTGGGKWITQSRRHRLYERDDYICQICHEPTDPDASHLSDWYPSLDHIVPRSKGGTHEDDNLRTAHRYCNAVLGDGTYYTDEDLKAPGSE